MIKQVKFEENKDFYCYPHWQDNHEKHYFFKHSRPLDFDPKQKDGLINFKKQLIKYYQLKYSYLVAQCHSNNYLHVCSQQLSEKPEIAADAIVVSDYKDFLNIGMAVYTADCMPILLKAENLRAIIHSGWKGLANKIVVKIIKDFHLENKPVSLLVGPHALVDDYEFGKSDLEQIESAVFRAEEGKYYLDQLATLSAQLEDFQVDLSYLALSTIPNPLLASHRRSPELGQRNISLYLI